MRSSAPGTALAVLAVAASACASPTWEPRSIDHAYLGQNAQILLLDAGICGEATRVDVSRAYGVLAVDLRVRGDHRGDCNQTVEIDLEQPLEDDRILDANFGHVVAVQHCSTGWPPADQAGTATCISPTRPTPR